jgi:hypothetical protein
MSERVTGEEKVEVSGTNEGMQEGWKKRNKRGRKRMTEKGLWHVLKANQSCR